MAKLLLTLAMLGPDDRGAAWDLVDVASAWGVAFRFESGSRGAYDLPEIMGGGLAVFDADGDGRLDLYFCNGGPIARADSRPDPPCRLFLNRGAGRFESWDAPGPGYAMGAAVGDVDGDGRPDLFVTGWRDQRLYRNRGAGRFEDVTERAGLTSRLWSTSSAFADLDADGDLDLYVANYLDYDPDRAPYCSAPDGRRDYCGPSDFPAQPARLYRNNGDGSFTDIAKEAGLSDLLGRGLGVLVADLWGDPKLDIFVANDGSPCWLLENRGGLRFRDVAAEAGVALDGQGRALAGMGVGLGDLNDDGRLDLVVSNFHDRGTVVFLRRDEGYVDASVESGVRAATRPVLGFGLGLLDLDRDGDLDLIQANGHVLDRERLGPLFRMPTTVLLNEGGRFAAKASGPRDIDARRVLGRGLSWGDLDGDGRQEVVIVPLDSPAMILGSTANGNSLHLRLDTKTANPPIGALVTLTVGGRIQTRAVVGGGSYLTAPTADVEFGMGSSRRVERLTVRWPSGRLQEFSNLEAGAYRLIEGRPLRADTPSTVLPKDPN